MQITIHTDLDFTPSGKRTARYVYGRTGAQLRWYVSGRIYSKAPPAHLTAEWLAGEGKPNHCPQPWSAFD